jgi:predicted nucleic acid-binding protein
MIVSFDTNVLVYATAAGPDKEERARDLIARGMRADSCVLLLQTLFEFSNVAIRKSGMRVESVQTTIEAWEAVLTVQAAESADLSAALDAVSTHKLSFWDALLWATAKRVGVRYLLTEDLQDGFQLDGVNFVNPFKRSNDQLIDRILPP